MLSVITPVTVWSAASAATHRRQQQLQIAISSCHPPHQCLFLESTCTPLVLMVWVIRICCRSQFYSHADELFIADLFRINHDTISDLNVLPRDRSVIPCVLC